MGFGERKEEKKNWEGSSRKGKLSFLLNDREDEGMGQGGGHHHNGDHHSTSSWSQVRVGHGGGASAAGGSGMTTTAMGQMKADGGDMRQYSKGVHGSSSSSGGGGGGSEVEKRGCNHSGAVRKKRQRKFICERCNFGFYTNSDLQKHVSSVHLLLRPYKCSMCSKKFGERSNATKHFKSVHERQKNAECEICHKVFAFRDGLVRHVRLVHENVRNFHCQFPGCGQAFKQSAHLKKHEQVHNKSRGAGAGAAGRS